MAKRNVIVLKEIQGGVTAPRGFKAAGVFCGIKRKKKDLALIYSDVPGSAAGVFTTNKVKAAPALVCMDRVSGGSLQAILVCSGNANACTGQKGLEDAYTLTKLTGDELGIDEHLVAATSTGVIGVPLPMDVIAKGIQQIVPQLTEDGGNDAAEAIMTTDTTSKQVAVELDLAGRAVRIGAMAKGSGMIHPNMATMLGFITTDARISHELLQTALSQAVNNSFNMITVDGDRSTNDSVLVIANGLSGCREIVAGTFEYEAFYAALEKVCIDLAKMIARDGEGATKLVEVRVRGAKTEEDARLVAQTIGNSLLVKTAIFGEDANWGRIICAVGYSGADIDPNTIDIYLGSVKVCEDGQGLPFDEAAASEVLRESQVLVDVNLKQGEGEAVLWTCDITYDYVKINASYRT